MNIKAFVPPPPPLERGKVRKFKEKSDIIEVMIGEEKEYMILLQFSKKVKRGSRPKLSTPDKS